MTAEKQLKLDYLSAVADWLLDLGDAAVRTGNLDEGLRYNHVAARVLMKQNRDLVSIRLESNLRSFGNRLPRPQWSIATRDGGSHQEVCLHVLNEAMGFGGLIAMATRWIKLDDSRIHHVAIISPSLCLPNELVQVVSRSGGKIFAADANQPLLDKADWLRRLANDVANFVVLHTDVDDVIAGTAFGIKGGPPVLLVNHAAHIFWTGASIADVVINCRGSQLEEFWTKSYRGIPRCATVPIPLSEPQLTTSRQSAEMIRKKQAKVNIGVPEDAILILTVGAAYKYTPLHGLNFLKVCESILSEIPSGFVVAAGVIEDSFWHDASKRCGLRIKALGSISQAQLAIIHDAADLYIEGFPFGSTTALLEAGLRGVPVVLGPAECPPPYCTDGVALDDLLHRPKDIAEYKAQIMQLCRNVVERESLGQKTRKAIRAHHTGIGWQHLLQECISQLPKEHDVYPAITPVRTPESIYQFWSEFLSKWSVGYENILEDSILHALSNGLRPTVTPTLKEVCKRFSPVREAQTIPLSWLVFLCNVLLPRLPISWSRVIFRITTFFCRGDLFVRMRKHAFQFLRCQSDAKAPHEQYRTNFHDLESQSFSDNEDGLSGDKLKSIAVGISRKTDEK